MIKNILLTLNIWIKTISTKTKKYPLSFFPSVEVPLADLVDFFFLTHLKMKWWSISNESNIKIDTNSSNKIAIAAFTISKKKRKRWREYSKKRMSDR